MSCQQLGSFNITEIYEVHLSTAHFIFKRNTFRCQVTTTCNCNRISNNKHTYVDIQYCYTGATMLHGTGYKIEFY